MFIASANVKPIVTCTCLFNSQAYFCALHVVYTKLLLAAVDDFGRAQQMAAKGMDTSNLETTSSAETVQKLSASGRPVRSKK